LIQSGFKNNAAGMAAKSIIKSNLPTNFKESLEYAKGFVKA
jgi:hypothetical protein